MRRMIDVNTFAALLSAGWRPRYDITAFNRHHGTPRDGSRLAAAEAKRARKAAARVRHGT